MASATSTLEVPARALPKVIRAGRFPLEERDFLYRYCSPTLALHIYDYFGTVRIGEDQLELQPGDLTLTPPNVVARYHLPRPGLHWCIHLRLAPQRPRRGSSGQTARLPLYFKLGAYREHAAQRVIEIARLLTCSSEGDQLSAAAADVATQDMLLWLAGLAVHPNNLPLKSEQAVERVLAILNQRFSEPLQVPELADEVELTQNHLARRFRARTGMTIPHYLLHRRIDHARLLLHTTDIPIQVIARRVGIPDRQYFNKAFRRTAGISPSRWRHTSRLGAQVY